MAITLHAVTAGRGSRLLLRPWLAADMAPLLLEMAREYPRRGLHPNFDADAAVPGCTGPTDEHNAVAWQQSQDRGWRDGDWLSFAVLERHQSAAGYSLVGSVALQGHGPGFRVGQGNVAEISYWTAAGARGRGIASAALQAVTAWAFGSFAASGLANIRLLHDLDNLASCRVAEKSGYAFAEISPANPASGYPAAHLHLAQPPGHDRRDA
jgi:RimJ/RimL family protein N-acetyltransferase